MKLQAQPAPGNWSAHPNRKVKDGIPPYAGLRLSILPESLWKELSFADEAPTTGIEALKTNVLIWGLFMSTTMKAAIHLGPHYVENLGLYKNTNFEELQNLFDITQKLTLDHQAEILSVTAIDWTAPSWTRSTLSHDQVTWTKARVQVHSDSVLCLAKMSDQSDAHRRKENQKIEFRQSNCYRALFGTDD